jgi:hypothetical protein
MNPDSQHALKLRGTLPQFATNRAELPGDPRFAAAYQARELHLPISVPLRLAKRPQRAIFCMATQHRYRLTGQSDKLDDPVSERNIATWQDLLAHEFPQDRWLTRQRCHLSLLPHTMTTNRRRP